MAKQPVKTATGFIAMKSSRLASLAPKKTIVGSDKKLSESGKAYKEFVQVLPKPKPEFKLVVAHFKKSGFHLQMRSRANGLEIMSTESNGYIRHRQC